MAVMTIRGPRAYFWGMGEGGLGVPVVHTKERIETQKKRRE